MVEYIILGTMALVTVMLLMLRTNTGVVFLSLCAGTMLLNATGADASLFASSLSSGADISGSVAKIAVLLLPAVITSLFLRKHVSHGQILITFVPAVATAMLGVLLVVPLLSSSVQASVGSTEVWSMLTQYQGTIVTIGIVSSIICIVLTVKKPHHVKHRKGKH